MMSRNPRRCWEWLNNEPLLAGYLLVALQVAVVFPLLASCSSSRHMRQPPAPSLQVERQAQQAEPPAQVAAPLGILGATGGWVFARRLRARIGRGR